MNIQSVDFEQIKASLIEKGLAYPESAAAATQKVIFVNGEWTRQGSAEITKTQAGWIVGDFAKCVPAKVDMPDLSGVSKNEIIPTIEAFVKNQYPDVMVRIKIM